MDGFAAEQVEDGFLAALEGKTDCLIAAIEDVARIEVAAFVLYPIAQHGGVVAIEAQAEKTVGNELDALGDVLGVVSFPKGNPGQARNRLLPTI